MIFVFFVFQLFFTVNIHYLCNKKFKSHFKYLCIQTIDISSAISFIPSNSRKSIFVFLSILSHFVYLNI